MLFISFGSNKALNCEKMIRFIKEESEKNIINLKKR